MEFTKLIKYASASLFLVLVGYGLILNFNILHLLLSLGLLLFLFKMEQSLILSERAEFNTKIQEILTSHKIEIDQVCMQNEAVVKQLHSVYEQNQKDMIAKIEATQSHIQTLKTAQGLTRRN